MARLLKASGHSLEISRAGEGIDRSQFRALLAMTPRQRLETATRDAHGLSLLLDAARTDRRPG
jgi:hypothetical protein